VRISDMMIVGPFPRVAEDEEEIRRFTGGWSTKD